MSNQTQTISEKSKQIQVMFDRISVKYNFLNRLLSFGQDVKWRKCTVSMMPVIDELDGVHYDIACGTGDLVFNSFCMRKDYRRFVGIDLSSGMLKIARLSAAKKNYPIEFIQASAESLPLPDSSAHCVTIAFGLRNVDDRSKAIGEFYRVLKPGGTLLVLEFFDGKKCLFSTIFKFYFNRILPIIGRIFSDKKAYQYLPSSVASMPSDLEFKKILTSHGFLDYVEDFSWLCGNVKLYIAKKS